MHGAKEGHEKAEMPRPLIAKGLRYHILKPNPPLGVGNMGIRYTRIIFPSSPLTPSKLHIKVWRPKNGVGIGPQVLKHKP